MVFSEPVLSTDGRLALVEVSLPDEFGGGFGQLCIMRRSASGWSAHCLDSWAT